VVPPCVLVGGAVVVDVEVADMVRNRSRRGPI
jgi:hypothetical protein